MGRKRPIELQEAGGWGEGCRGKRRRGRSWRRLLVKLLTEILVKRRCRNYKTRLRRRNSEKPSRRRERRIRRKERPWMRRRSLKGREKRRRRKGSEKRKRGESWRRLLVKLLTEILVKRRCK